jgi:DNA-binding CsgD family transcriptional regulator/transcriptional regulator with XRE-family HTH domain
VYTPRRTIDDEEQSSLEGLGLAISRLRQGRGETRSAVAERAGLTITTISDLEKAVKEWPKWGTLRRLAKGLEVDLGVLIALALELAPGPAGEVLRRRENEFPSIDILGLSNAAVAGGKGPEGGDLESLTPRERRLTVMAAGGLTNPEIASALDVSRYSVEASLSRVFRKLGIRNRHQIQVTAKSFGEG